ncbi:MAG TPA: HAMP domain-containing protein [Verrucomicrobiae bacterium]|nr:HAMP domain-containing protein [Verrucomicrobiae bacterium]
MAYSLAIVRLILVPVIFLAVYYLYRMSWIVDRIVSIDAQAATLAEQASIEMLEARRAERNYLLLHDSSYLQVNREAVTRTRQTFSEIHNLEPDEQAMTQKALDDLDLYQQRFAAAVETLGRPGGTANERIQAVVRAYEKDLDDLLRQARYRRRSELVDELRARVGSFDSQISTTVQEGDPALRQVTSDLQSSSQEILQLASELEARNWKRVEDDHHQARRLINQAEWALGIVSAITFLLSVWISFILPRQVAKPLVSLKEAVDQASAGDEEINFDIQGEGEVAQLARSVQNLILRIRQKV